MSQAIAGWRAVGMMTGLDSMVDVFAEGCLAAVRRIPTNVRAEVERRRITDHALGMIADLLGPDVQCGQSYETDICRLRGELLLERDGSTSGAEAAALLGHGLAPAGPRGMLGE